MANKYVQLKDSSGNNLYPVVADFPISVSDGGTGATTAQGALANLLANVVSYAPRKTTTSTSPDGTTYTYQVVGSGLVFAGVSVIGDTTSDYGTTTAMVKVNDVEISRCTHRLYGQSSTESLSAAASIFLPLNNGDTIKLIGGSSRNGTKTISINIVALGCSLVAQ